MRVAHGKCSLAKKTPSPATFKAQEKREGKKKRRKANPNSKLFKSLKKRAQEDKTKTGKCEMFI